MTTPLDETENFVNVVFATDEEYLPITAVAITSVAKNYSDSRRLRIFLLIEKDLPSNAAGRFAALSGQFGFSFQPIVISAADFSTVRTSRGISIATYFRLYMHLVLPVNAEKAVYLDSDMIIADNIGTVFDTDLGDNLFAATEDYNSIAHRRAYGTPSESVNINAGVLVCNLKVMREIDFANIVQTYISKHQYRIFHGDQQILNSLFHDRMMYIHIRWNMHGQLFDAAWVRANMRNRAYMTPQEIAEGVRNPAIIHYNGPMKPWNGGNHAKRREWYKYSKQSTYADMFVEPNWPKATSKKSKPTLRDRIYKKLWLDKLYRALVEGYDARGTRLLVDKMFKKDGIWKEKPFNDLRTLSEKSTMLQIHQYLTMRGMKLRERNFSASDYVKSLPENAKIFSNAPGDDLEGGFHENVKQIFRSAHIGSKVLPYESHASLILHMAVRTPGFWDVLTASQFDRDLLFGEATFFGAYCGYFDKEAPAIARRPFGYILDDMGYYYDARQPSRLETKLNDPSYQINESDTRRCKKLINRVIGERLTKYNRYAGRGTSISLEPNSVVVIDQTPHDASIKFGSAERRTILDMVNAALNENPGAPVYFKRHPDNVQKVRDTLQSTSRVQFLPDDCDITQALDQCAKVYVVTSQVGFEAILRGKEVVTFGMPFYAGWGLTDDRQPFRRRTQKRTVEDLFYAACIDMSVYLNPITDEVVEIEEAFDVIGEFRKMEEPAVIVALENREAAE